PPHAPPQGPAGAPVRRPGVRRPLVDSRARGAGCGDHRHPAVRDGMGAAEALQGRRDGDGAGEPARAVPAVLRHLREGQRVRPAGCRGIHPAVRPRDPHRRGARRGAQGRARRGGRLMASQHRTETPQHQMWGGRAAGRWRNEQVATDLRLWTRGAIGQREAELAQLGSTLVARARDGMDDLLPGYTHGQRAQPVRWAYVLAAHAWPLVRDRQRLADARRRVAELPLGSGALAGSGFAVDRVLLKEALGFRSVSPNALDATGDRDFVAEVLFALTLVGTHLSRLAAEIVLYTSAEFGFVTLSDAFSTGSSLMPQKRNPDVFELARGKAGRLLGDLVALLTTLKGIPAGYQKDLQEDKVLLFDACDTLAVVLPAVTGAIDTLTVNADKMAAALDPAMRATDLADLLVEAGVPFRESHGLIGKLVRAAEQSGVTLDKVSTQIAAEIH